MYLLVCVCVGGGGGGLSLYRELKFNVSVSMSGLRDGVGLPAGGIRASQDTFSSFDQYTSIFFSPHIDSISRR